MDKNKKIFIVSLSRGIIPGELLSVVNDEKFKISLNSPKGKQIREVPKNSVFFKEEDAKREIVSLIWTI